MDAAVFSAEAASSAQAGLRGKGRQNWARNCTQAASSECAVIARVNLGR